MYHWSPSPHVVRGAVVCKQAKKETQELSRSTYRVWMPRPEWETVETNAQFCTGWKETDAVGWSTSSKKWIHLALTYTQPSRNEKYNSSYFQSRLELHFTKSSRLLLFSTFFLRTFCLNREIRNPSGFPRTTTPFQIQVPDRPSLLSGLRLTSLRLITA